MQRKFPYITVGKILAELNSELREKGLLKEDEVAITRPSFYRLEKRMSGFPEGRRTGGERPWRTYSEEEKDKIKEIIIQYYNFSPEVDKKTVV